MSEMAIMLTWYGIVGIIGLNGFAAGVSAIFHAWRPGMRLGSRIFASAALTGVLPASVFIPIAFTDREFIMGEGPAYLAIGFGIVLATAMVVCLPGALIVARKLEAPGADHREFE